MLTALLEAFTREIGQEEVVGAIVLCSLERPLDEAILHSQSEVADEDTTPDDLWYSPLGEGYRIR